MSLFRPEEAIPNASGATPFGLGIRAVDNGHTLVIVTNGTSNGTGPVAIDVQFVDTATGDVSAPQIVTPRGSQFDQLSTALWGDVNGGLGVYVAAWQDTDYAAAVGETDLCAVRFYSPNTKRWEDITVGPRLMMNGGMVEQKPVHVLRLTSGRFLVVYNAWEPNVGVAQIRGRLFDPVTLTFTSDTLLYQGTAGVDDYTNHPMYACARVGGVRDEAHLLVYNDPLTAATDTAIHLSIVDVTPTRKAGALACAGQLVVLGGRTFCISPETVVSESTNILRESMGIGIRDDGSLLAFYWQKFDLDPTKYDRLYYTTKLAGDTAWSQGHLFRDWQELYGLVGPPTVPGFLNCSGVDVVGHGQSWHFVWDEQRNSSPGDGNADVFYGRITFPFTAPLPPGPPQAFIILTDIVQLNPDHGGTYADVQPKLALSVVTQELVPVWADNVYESTARGDVSAKWAPCSECLESTEEPTGLESGSGECVSVICAGADSPDSATPLETQAEAVVVGTGLRNADWLVP